MRSVRHPSPKPCANRLPHSFRGTGAAGKAVPTAETDVWENAGPARRLDGRTGPTKKEPTSRDGDFGSGSGSGMSSEDAQIAMAISASMRDDGDEEGKGDEDDDEVAQAIALSLAEEPSGEHFRRVTCRLAGCIRCSIEIAFCDMTRWLLPRKSRVAERRTMRRQIMAALSAATRMKRAPNERRNHGHAITALLVPADSLPTTVPLYPPVERETALGEFGGAFWAA